VSRIARNDSPHYPLQSKGGAFLMASRVDMDIGTRARTHSRGIQPI